MSILYTSPGRSRKRKNPTKAELEAELNFEKLQKTWDAFPKFSSRSGKPKNAAKKLEVQMPNLRIPAGRNAQAHPSQVTAGGSTATREIPKYTGTKMIGIGQLHKSNSVPVFAADDAKDIARMRR